MSTRYLTENTVETLYGYVSIASKAERLFWNAWSTRCGQNITAQLRPQSKIGNYRVDFAHEPSKTVVEIDGWEHYRDPDVIANDRERQKYLESRGWQVVRFGNWKVFKNAEVCADELWAILTKKVKIHLATKAQYHPGDKVSHAHCGEGVVIESEIEAGAEFVTVQFKDKRLRLNTSGNNPLLTVEQQISVQELRRRIGELLTAETKAFYKAYPELQLTLNFTLYAAIRNEE